MKNILCALCRGPAKTHACINVSVSIPSKMISNNCAAERNPTPAGLPTIFQCCIVHATRMGLATTVSSPKSLALGTDVLAIFIFPWVGAQWQFRLQHQGLIVAVVLAVQTQRAILQAAGLQGGSLAATPFQHSNPRRKSQGVSACSFQELKLGGGTTSWNHWKPTKCVVQWQVCHLLVVWSNVISDLIVFDIQISAFATHSAARIPSICIWHSKGSCTLRLGLSPSHNCPVQVKCKASWSRIESDLHGGQHFVLLSTLSFSWLWLPRPGC